MEISTSESLYICTEVVRYKIWDVKFQEPRETKLLSTVDIRTSQVSGTVVFSTLKPGSETSITSSVRISMSTVKPSSILQKLPGPNSSVEDSSPENLIVMPSPSSFTNAPTR